MGLDMYLEAERAVAEPELTEILSLAGVTTKVLADLAASPDEGFYLSMWRHEEAAERERAERIVDLAGLTPFRTDDSSGGWLRYRSSPLDQPGFVVVSTTCVYWRKSNAIHNWFVNECQGGIDECQETPVEAEQLAYLHATCVKAIDAYDHGDKAEAAGILTPTPGCFFGSTDIDDWWAEDVRRTILELERVINLAIRTGGVQFYYHSSW